MGVKVVFFEEIYATAFVIDLLQLIIITFDNCPPLIMLLPLQGQSAKNDEEVKFLIDENGKSREEERIVSSDEGGR